MTRSQARGEPNVPRVAPLADEVAEGSGERVTALSCVRGELLVELVLAGELVAPF